MELPEYPSGGRIAFGSDRDGNGEIYVMGCDGTSQTNLTNHSSGDKQPSWSGNGKLAFSSNRNAAGGYDIYILTLDPWNILRVTASTSDDESPALSPDGTRVAFVSTRDGNSEIYVASLNEDVPAMTRVTNNTASDGDPAWSPDGNRLLFASEQDGDWDVFLTDTALGNPANLTDSTADDRDGDDDRWPDMAFYDYGDGTSENIVVFASNRDGDWEIFTMGDDGSAQTQSTANGSGLVDAEPSWDPLAEYVTIHSNRDGNYEVATMYYDGSEYSNISRVGNSDSASSGDSSPDWEPVTDGVYCGE